MNIKEFELFITNELKNIKTTTELTAFEVKFLSRNGELSKFTKSIKNLPENEKKQFGIAAAALKNKIEAEFKTIKDSLELNNENNKNNNNISNFDVTLNFKKYNGSLHPYSLIIAEIEDIFLSMGFQSITGPELEHEENNFTKLNIPQNHPARAETDTFWINPELLLRTHTTTVQIQELKKTKPPIAIISPGRTFRNESTDSTHDFMFMQVDGVFVDKNVSISNLLAVLREFLTALFNKNIKLRVRPGFFPFVEPGLEIDASCPFCNKGCSVCKHTQWIELLGAGCIHPAVLKAVNINPSKYSGFAFGAGITRLAMLKYNIPDVRLLHSGNLKFLQQF